MKKKKWLEDGLINSTFPAETEFERAIREMEAREARMCSFMNSPIAQAAMGMAASSLVDAAGAMIPIQSRAVLSMTNSLDLAATALDSYHNVNFFNSDVLSALDVAVKTPELLKLQTQFEANLQNMENGLSAVLGYVDVLTNQWNSSLMIPNIAERSIAAQNLAMVKMLPGYRNLDLPRGSKRVLRSLTKTAAEKLLQTEDVLFDPKEKEFYHKDSPEQTIDADQITVAESSQELFADISLDELISFESQLYDDVTFALEHPVGKKIFEIIKNWNKFISFDDTIYYHARKIEEGQSPFLDQEMLKAPLNVSSHGRYNAIGKSCYYIAESEEGAVMEITKHCGGKKASVQVAGLKPIRSARIIDLSREINGINRFMEHMRFSVENEEGKIIKKYLLPNFVASCCKKIGIEGIKYMSTGYNCYVLWKDDYFKFVEGSRNIV